jgi:predicted nucleic acid-binding protein
MILADTSVIIAYLRTADPNLLATLKHQGAVVCGITRAEVLCGVRNPVDHSRFTAALNALPQAPIPDALWDTIGLNLATLRSAGLTMSLADVAIASMAVHLGVELWARDQHFQLMQTVQPSLRLFREPP